MPIDDRLRDKTIATTPVGNVAPRLVDGLIANSPDPTQPVGAGPGRPDFVSAIFAQQGVTQGSGNPPVNPGTPTLGPLAIAPNTATVGVAYTGTLTGATAGSTIVLDAMTISGSGSARGVSGTPSTAGSWSAIETLAGAIGSPRTSTAILTVAAAPVTPPGPGTGDPNRLMFGSTRSGWMQAVAIPGSGQEARVSKSGWMTPDYAVQTVAPVLSNFKLTADGRIYPEGDLDGSNVSQPDGDIGNAINIYKITLQVGSTYYSVPFSGSTAGGSITDGGTVVIPPFTLPAPIPARTKCFWIIGDFVSAGQKQPGGLDRQSNNGEQIARAASFTDGWFDGSVAIPNGSNIGAPGVNTGRLFAPVTTLMKGWDGRPVVMCEGDSMASPANDIGNFTPDSGVQGWLARGLDSNANGTQRYPNANMAVAGTRPSGMSSRNAGLYRRRGQAMDAMRAANAALGLTGTDGKGLPPFTAILSEHINNDASGQPTTSGLQTVMNNYWAFLKTEYPDTPIVQTAAMCACTSDNSQWTTYAGQTYRTTDAVAGTGSRWQVSDGYIGSKPTVLSAVIDQTPLMMDTTLRKWGLRSFTGALAADYVAGALTVSLTAAPLVGEAILVNAGTANATKPTFVSAVTGSGPYTVTLFTALAPFGGGASVAITSGAPVAAAATPDGLHASPLVHIELAAAIVAAKTAGKFGASSGTTPVTLNALTVSPSGATVGTAFSGSISGRTSGSTLSLTGAGSAGLSISGTTISGTPTTAGAVNIVETLSGATNTPRTSSGVVTVAAAGAPSVKTMDSTTATMDSSTITMDAA